MNSTQKAPPAGAADRVFLLFEEIEKEIAKRDKAVPIDAKLVEKARVLREEVARLVSDSLRHIGHQSEEIMFLKLRMDSLTTTEAEALVRAEGMRRDADRVQVDAQALADARAAGERAADARYKAAAMGDAELEAFVEATRIRTGEDLAKRWRERKGA